ncbi:WXG100 family type VII secretion target [Actinoplanes subglobosus]|uniref:WXG100 family type VII secretion target n=1 Tax=Actinoplanes subglobosus TaxID=1547892 RepID=A0ABV8IZH6_9ACTN
MTAAFTESSGPQVTPTSALSHASGASPASGLSLADSFQGVLQAVDGGGWADSALAGGAFAAEAVATVIDPFGALLANGLGWALEYFEPLREILDRLTGLPDVVAAHAAAWHDMATELGAMAGDLQSCLTTGTPDWQGEAAATYQNLMANNVDVLGGLSVLADTMSSATRAAGNLVTLTRDLVRDLIADLVARVIIWAGEALLVVTIPVVAAQIASAVAKWAGRIASCTSALITSLSNLTRLLNS